MLKILNNTLLVLFLFSITANRGLSQADTTRKFQYIDDTDLIKVIRGNRNKKVNDTGIPEKGKLMLLLVPIIGSNPSLGAFYGIGGTAAIFFGDPYTTSISNLNASMLFTTKDQFIGTIKGVIMTNENKWELITDIRYSLFSESTYGLGSDDNLAVHDSWNIGGIQTTGISGAQPMTFNQIKFHFIGLKQFINNLYLGIGFHYDKHYNIHDLSLDLEAESPVITSHYAYSLVYGFDTSEYVSSGTSVNVVFDSRDHTVNTYSGSFLHFSYRINSDMLESEKSYQQLYLEARIFKSLSSERPRHILGFWGIGHFNVVDESPYLHLPANAYDMRNRIGRGYVAGRFRGPGWFTAETEYRFPVSKNGLFGGVLFASVTSTSRKGIQIGEEYFEELKLAESMKYAAGFGGRIMLNRTGRLNLTLDMAFGQNGSKGFYFGVAETF